MSFRDILAVVTSQAANEHVIAFANQLASQTKGRVTAAVVNWEPNFTPAEGWALDPLYGQLLVDARNQLASEADKLKTRLAREEAPSSVEPYLLDIGAAGVAVGMRARHADVSIVARPTQAHMESGQAILDAVLFEAGRPVIFVPPEWKPGKIGRRILVAWKPTREAARALADADAFIGSAESVSIVTVDGKPSRGYGEQPGADIAAHLAYRGAKAELFNLASGGRSESEAIMSQAVSLGADLVVMGGYGRSRMSEFIFGGVTRGMLRHATVPVLMSH